MQVHFLDRDASDIGKLQFQHPLWTDNVAGSGKFINLSCIIPHSWQRELFSSTRTAYKQAVERSKMSGTHDDDFFLFCNGRMDALYMHFHLGQRPSLCEMVTANLPANAFYDSGVPDKRSIGDDEAVENDTPAKKRRSTGSQIAGAISSFVARSAQSGVDEEKAAYYKNRDTREQAKEAREQENFRLQADARAFEEWTKLSDRIRSLRCELLQESDADNRADIQHEIELLKKKRDTITIRL